jgi:hypothetical protein
MSEPFYRAKTWIEKVDGLHRRAHLPMGHCAEFGVHGPIKDLFRLQTPHELPLPVDYIVAATGG